MPRGLEYLDRIDDEDNLSFQKIKRDKHNTEELNPKTSKKKTKPMHKDRHLESEI